MNTIRTLREAAGLSQAGLARAANISQSHISEIESGAKNLGLKVARAIAKALHVPVATVLGESEAKEHPTA